MEVRNTTIYPGQVIRQLEVKLSPGAVMPSRAHETDAGLDLCALEGFTLAPGQRTLVDTGVAVKIPVGFMGLLASRSGYGSRGMTLANGVGIIDSGYRDTIKVMLLNTTQEEDFQISAGSKIAQLIIVPISLISPVDYWNDSERLMNGFGSTGV